jgi:hypothetical protein
MGLGKKFAKKIKKAGEKVTDKTKSAADRFREFCKSSNADGRRQARLKWWRRR